MTEFKDISEGIWEAKRKDKEGPYNVLIKVYGEYPFFEVSVWDYNLTLKGELSNRIGVRDIVKFEFGNKIKELI